MKERKQCENASVKHKATLRQLKRNKVVCVGGGRRDRDVYGWGGGGIGMFMVNILVYTKRQKAPNADRKHETT